MRWDAVVIGAGHNGLVAALTLARAGRKTLVLERSPRPGGLCAADEFHPGFWAPGLLQETACFRPELARRLGLESHGLRFQLEESPTLVLNGGGPPLAIFRDAQEGAQALAAVSRRDAEAYIRWRAFLARVRPFARRLLDQPPPPLSVENRGDLWELARRGLDLRRLGRKDMLELMRVAPMCAADWLNEHFETPGLCEALAAPAVEGGFVGPWAAGTAANLLIYECTADRALRGGPASLIAALLPACRESGVELRCGAEAAALRVPQQRVSGVQLASGEEISAPIVVASCDPKKTFLELIHPAQLPLRVQESFHALRARGTTAKMNLAVKGPLDFNHWNGRSCESVWIGGGHLDGLEKAFDAVKYRQISELPCLDLRIPTVSDPRLAPADGHVISMLIHCAPLDLAEGWTPEARAGLQAKALAILEEHAGPLQDRMVACQLLAPPDIEARYGVSGGHIHHVEHALDQLLCMRPAPFASRYATPIEGLYLAGSGCHPGGGVTGMPGALAAATILATE